MNILWYKCVFLRVFEKLNKLRGVLSRLDCWAHYCRRRLRRFFLTPLIVHSVAHSFSTIQFHWFLVDSMLLRSCIVKPVFFIYIFSNVGWFHLCLFDIHRELNFQIFRLYTHAAVYERYLFSYSVRMENIFLSFLKISLFILQKEQFN